MRTLLAWLFGFVTAVWPGSEPEALLNQCAQRGLTLWKMERLDPVTLLVKVPATQWRRVEALAERMGCQAEDVQRRACPIFWGASGGGMDCWWGWCCASSSSGWGAGRS